MEIELYFADQLVPTGELFRALQSGTIDARAFGRRLDGLADVEVRVFGGYFPFATSYILDVPVLFNQYGLDRHLARGLCQGRRAMALGRRLGPLQLQHQEADHARSRTSRA